VNEPANHTAWVDAGGGTWVRYDEYFGREVAPTKVLIEPWGPWWPLTDGPGWAQLAHDGIGTPRPWDQVEPFHGPMAEADPERTARALARVRREVES
jgi:hypothetical protein